VRRFILEQLGDSELISLITPIYNFFEKFLFDDKKLVLKTPMNNGDRNGQVHLEESYSFKKIGKSRKNIEKVYSESYLDKQISEIKSNSILDDVARLNKFAGRNDYLTLKSLSYSLLTNLNQFVDDNRKFRTATKWRKVVNSYISVTLVAQELRELELVRSGFSNKPVIISLGLVDYEDVKIKASEEIQNIINLVRTYNNNNNNNNDNFVIVPIYGCTTNVFYNILQDFSNIQILHIAGHGGIVNSDKGYIQFSDANMGFPAFYDKLRRFNRYLNVMFLNCCYSYEFVEGSKVDISNETIVHTDKLYDPIAIDFSNHYFSQLFSSCLNSNSLTNAWQTASQNCTENPMNYYRLQ
jgi:hypothetical protein